MNPELLCLPRDFAAGVELIQSHLKSLELCFGVLWSMGLCSSHCGEVSSHHHLLLPSISLHFPSHFSRTIFLLNHKSQVSKLIGAGEV